MTDFRKGDTVRISKVITLSHDKNGGFVDTYRSADWDIELVEKAAPKVGDTLKGELAYENLPVGAVVYSGHRRSPLYFKTTTGWQSSDSSPVSPLWAKRELVFLP